jgi:ligand-binding sensor domain-containing protein/two-component sensor histidine kinase
VSNHQLYIVSFFIFLASCRTGHVQAQATGIKYTHFTRHDVLASNQVNCIIQDKQKFIWFATSNGIQRFDGNRWLWLTHQKNSSTSLPDDDVALLLEDDHERLWVQTASGICLLNRNNLEFTKVKIAWLPAHTSHILQSLVALKDGRVWLTIAGGGLYYYNEPAKQFVPADNIIPPSPWFIYQIAYDSLYHRYYLGTDKGIVIYNTIKKEFYHPGFNPSGIGLLQTAPARESNVTLYLNDSARLWFSSLSVHSCYDIRKDSLLFCDSTSKIWGVLGYTTDRSGTTWSYGATIAKMNMVTGHAELIQQTPDALYGINFQNGGYLMEDSENTYWLATNNGVYLYNRFQQQFFQHPIKNYSTGEIFKHINVWGFIELADSGIVALTTRGEGLYYFDKNLQQLPAKFNLTPYANTKSYVNIRCGIRDQDNHLWVGCERGPLLKLYPENGKVEKLADSSFTKDGIYCMAVDNRGNLWMGTFHHTIIRRDAVTGKCSNIVSTVSNEKGVDNVYCLLYDGNKYIWAATAKSGLLKINTQTLLVEKSYTNGPGPTIYSLTKNSFNQLMMATPDGIVVMDIDKESFRVLTTADGLPDNNIASFVKEKQKVWFASDNGISKIKMAGMTTTSYGIMEGLTDESFNIGAGIQLSDGRILFGHNEGFTSFNPAAYEKQVVSQEVSITGIRLFDKYLDRDSILRDKKEMVLNYHQNFLSIEFSNMSFLGKDHTSYYHQLEGVDKEWITTRGMPQAVYNYLPGGEYIFNVKCQNSNGTISSKITSFRIRIIPPLWRTWWFYVLGAAVVCGLLYLFLRTRYQHELAAEKGRNRIAKDLHDDMGSSLSTINILSEMARKKIDSDIPATKKFINQISDNSNRIMESLDDIVWNIDTANDSMENTLSRMREFAGNLLEARDISYTFKADETIWDIHLELGRRHDFFMIFKEAVNNLAKYSGCATVSIGILLRKNNLVLRIADDGKGFQNNQLFEGNGLTNMQQRASALKGVLSIQSEINQGTTVILKVPV